MNLAYRSADFTDADNNAAISGAVIAAMHGTRALPEKLVAQLRDRVFADKLGPLPVKPPVDESISALGRRTAAIGEQILAENGARLDGGVWHIPRHEVRWQTTEVFALNDLMAFWAPGWTLHRAGHGAPGGGVRNVRGGTFLDGSILATYPRDEVRGLCLRRDDFQVPKGKPKLEVEVSVDPGRAWQLAIYLDDWKALSKTLDGGPALDYRDLSPLSQPESVHVQNKAARKWQKITLDLGDYAGRTVTLRLYQTILVPDRAPGNAYWRGLRLLPESKP